MSNIRQERLAALLFEELSILIGGELEDPRIALTNVTDVVVSSDLRNVKVYVTNDDEEVSRKELLAALRRATPFLRGEIAVRCSLRAVPELLFYYDNAPQRAARIDELLRTIAQERDPQAGEQPHSESQSQTQGGDSTSDTVSHDA